MRLAALFFLGVGLVPVFDALATRRTEDAVWRKRSIPMLSRSRKALPHPLKICAWNLKTFGAAKMDEPERAELITLMVHRCDIIGILEVRDKSGGAQTELANMVGPSYGRVESERIGTTSYKESILVFYRLDRVEVIGVRQYPITDDQYEREPYTVLFSPVGTTTPTADPCAPCAAPPEGSGGFEFAVTFFHAKPKSGVTIQEIDDLIFVYDDILETFGIDDVIFAGDLNADCAYAEESQIQLLPIYYDSLFYWPITTEADTATHWRTVCAYDRFILTGGNVRAAYVGGSAGIFNYTIAYGLTYAETYDLSDHYPIELLLI